MKQTLIFLSILVSLFIYFHLYTGNETASISQVTKENTNSDTTAFPDEQLKTAEQTERNRLESNLIKTAANNISKANPEILPADALVMIKWQHDRGYPMFDMSGDIYKNDYDNYTLDILKELSASGDRIAMQKLGAALLQKGNFTEAEKYLWDASVRGYTMSIAEMSNIYLIKHQKELDEDLKKENAIIAFSLMEVALLRGDLMTHFTKSMYSNIKFSEDDKQKIQQLSLNYFDKLSKERRELGFSEFDNSYPKALSQWTSQFIKKVD